MPIDLAHIIILALLILSTVLLFWYRFKFKRALRQVTLRVNLDKQVGQASQIQLDALAEMREIDNRIFKLAKSVTQGLLVADVSGQILLINKTTEVLTDRSFQQIVGQDLLQFFATFGSNVLEAFQAQDLFQFSVGEKNDNLQVLIEASVERILDKNDKPCGTLVLFRDISREQEIEKMKSDFITTAAHELKTPLTSVLGYSEILLTRDNLTDSEIKKFLGYIYDQAGVLSQTISKLLDISKLESAAGLQLEKRPANIGNLVEEVISDFSTRKISHRFDVKLLGESPELELYVDEIRIKQVLANLVSNAIKFSPAGECIKIHGQSKHKYYQVCVSNQGAGMTKSQLERYRAEVSSRSAEASGLGMSIVKYLVELHGGNLSIESKPNHGTQVSFTLPLRGGL